jgi:hypothetical protein
MKKIVIVIFSLLFISCFTEPKKTNENRGNIESKEASYVNKNLNLTDTINNKDIEIKQNLLQKNIKNSKKTISDLDRVYLGTNLFHEGSGGTWGKATISKKNNYYWIKGEHKMSDGDWIKIEGKILNPLIDSFTFDGIIKTYSPSAAEWLNKTSYLKKENKIYNDTCVWVGKTVANKLFENRKYWRIRSYDCYNYGHDVDIFHN